MTIPSYTTAYTVEHFAQWVIPVWEDGRVKGFVWRKHTVMNERAVWIRVNVAQICFSLWSVFGRSTGWRGRIWKTEGNWKTEGWNKTSASCKKRLRRKKEQAEMLMLTVTYLYVSWIKVKNKLFLVSMQNVVWMQSLLQSLHWLEPCLHFINWGPIKFSCCNRQLLSLKL